MNNYLFWKRFAQGKLKTHVSSIKIRIPSPKEILSWSERRLPNSTLVGKIDNAHTVEHDTLRPVSGGLFCERIFGPIATNVCACLRRKGWNENYCKICEVQFTKSRLRRYQMGHILLAAPVIHIWALQGGNLASLLGKKNLGIRSIAYGKVMCQSKLWANYAIDKDVTSGLGSFLYNPKEIGECFYTPPLPPHASYLQIPEGDLGPTPRVLGGPGYIEDVTRAAVLHPFEVDKGESTRSNFQINSINGKKTIYLFNRKPLRSSPSRTSYLGCAPKPISPRSSLRMLSVKKNSRKVKNFKFFINHLMITPKKSQRNFLKNSINISSFTALPLHLRCTRALGHSNTFGVGTGSTIKNQENNHQVYKVYERGNILPFHQFILYKPDTFDNITQFFSSLNKEKISFPLPHYSKQKILISNLSPCPRPKVSPLICRTYIEDVPLGGHQRCDVPSGKVLSTCKVQAKNINFRTQLYQKDTVRDFGIFNRFNQGGDIFKWIDSRSMHFIYNTALGPEAYSYGQGLVKRQYEQRPITFLWAKGTRFSSITSNYQSLVTIFINFFYLEKLEKVKAIKTNLSKFSLQFLNKKSVPIYWLEKSLEKKFTQVQIDTWPLTIISKAPLIATTTPEPFRGKYIVGKNRNAISFQSKDGGNHLLENKKRESYSNRANPCLNKSHNIHQRRQIYSNFQKIVNIQTNKGKLTNVRNIAYTGSSVLFQTLRNSNLVLLDSLTNWKWKKAKTQLNSLLLQNKLTKKKRNLRNKLARVKIVLTKRKNLVQSFLNTKQLPEWMILSILPVLPPALRPILELEPNNIVVSDLNVLYQTVIRRNDALMGLLTFRALEIDILNRQVSLQQSIEKLFDKGAGTKKRPVKSLSQGFHGKKGLFRSHLLGKRVDYSGRSVIVVGPQLKLHECGLPKEMALVLFLPFLIARLKKRRIISNTSQAKQLILNKDKQIWINLKSLIYEHPVLLNRAPTLHRLGFQAFQPILVSGKAMVLPALVCTGFNADFDGDQMAVHVPLSHIARAESWKLLHAKNNMLSPATGKPIIVLSQEMILGCYCSTLILNKTFVSNLKLNKLKNIRVISSSTSSSAYGAITKNDLKGDALQLEPGTSLGTKKRVMPLDGWTKNSQSTKIFRKVEVSNKNNYFTTFQEIYNALGQNKIVLQTAIWLRIPFFEDNQFLEEPLEIRLDVRGHFFRFYCQSQRHFSKDIKSQDQMKGISYVRTSAGRIQLNETFYSSISK